MEKIIIFLCFFLISLSGYCQNNFFFIGQKSYPCTETLTVGINKNCNYFRSPLNENYLEVIVVKNGINGFFIFKSLFEINGTALLYLDDNNVIKLIDRNIHDKVDGRNFTVYVLTSQEINKLKKNNIRTIRYNRFSSGTTIDNIDNSCKVYAKENDDGARKDLWGKYVKDLEYKRVDFPDLVNRLFD